jgi:transcriptional repressor NrdR
MQCPFCQTSGEVRVRETRTPDPGEVRRHRVCGSCGEQFTTVERISAHDTIIIKRGDRQAERFSRMKLRRGIEKAAAAWTLAEGELDSLVERVVKRLHPKPNTPVSSAEIGSLVLRVLAGDRPATAITRIRFAIVLLGRTSRVTRFRGLHDFLAWLEAEYGPSAIERPVNTPSVVVKRDGETRTFNIKKLERSIGVASKGRGSDKEVERLAAYVAARAAFELQGQAIVTSQQIAAEVLKVLKERDALAYLRYASAVKRYRSVDDFWLDALGLLEIGDDGRTVGQQNVESEENN